MVNGSHKGGAFERLICKKLSLWCSGGEDQDIFWRTAGSGARAQTAYKSGRLLKAHAGDICSIVPRGEELIGYVFFECKHVKDLGLKNAVVNRSSEFEKHYKKAVTQSNQYSKIPIVIVQQNRCPILLAIEKDMLNHSIFTSSLLASFTNIDERGVDVFHFEKFLDTVSYEFFLRVLREWYSFKYK